MCIGSARILVDDGKLTKSGEPIARLASCWLKEESDIAIKLSTCMLEDSGCHRAELVLTKEERQKEILHHKNLIEYIYKNSEFSASYLFKDLNKKVFSRDSLKKLTIGLKFRGRKFVASMKIPAKDGGKAIGQTTNLLKQLRDSGLEDEINIIANYGRKQSGTVTLKELNRENEYNEDYSLIDPSLKKESIKEFIVSYECDLGRDFFSRRKIITNIENITTQFYREITARFF